MWWELAWPMGLDVAEFHSGDRVFLVIRDAETRVMLSAYCCADRYWWSLKKEEKEVWVATFLDRTREVAGRSRNAKIEWGEKEATTFPNVIALLEAKIGDGEGADNRFSLTLFAQDGVLKACVRDKADACCLWVSFSPLMSLWKALEAALADPQATWRADRYAAPKGKGKGK